MTKRGKTAPELPTHPRIYQLPEEVGAKWRRFTDCDILDGVGSTEMLHIFLSNRPGDVVYGTSGVAAPGYEPLVTHVFIGGDPNIDCDVVFGVKDELIATIEKRTDPTMPDGKPAAAPWHLMTYEFKVRPGGGEAPKPLAAKATEDA